MPGSNDQVETGADAQPISMVVVTMSVGAVILLLMLVCGIGRVASKDDQEKREGRCTMLCINKTWLIYTCIFIGTNILLIRIRKFPGSEIRNQFKCEHGELRES